MQLRSSLQRVSPFTWEQPHCPALLKAPATFMDAAVAEFAPFTGVLNAVGGVAAAVDNKSATFTVAELLQISMGTVQTDAALSTDAHKQQDGKGWFFC